MIPFSELLNVKKVIPSIYVELKYATADNFTGKIIYDFTDAYLLPATADKLKVAQSILLEQGFSLKVLDAYRPLYAQFKLWEIMPNDDFVANPTNGGCSRHNRGIAVDVTLVTADGCDLEMPSEYDDFTGKASRTYEGSSEAAYNNMKILESAMIKAGFKPYINEWWHYNDIQ